MRVFLLDLWMDLREKRLAPVALGLLAAIVVVPIVLAKGTSNEPTTPTTTTTAAAPGAPVIQSNPQAGPVESKLQTFSPRDPFEPTGHIPTPTTTSPSTGTGTGTTTGTTGTGTTGGGTTGTGGGTTGNTGGGTTTERRTTLFTYTVDIRYGPPGDEKAMKDVQRLELIPDQKKPQLVFLGVTTTGRTAVFLVDSSLGVDTNGKCKPSGDQCTFLYLRPDGRHDQAELTDQDGNSFRLHLLAVHRVTVSSSTGTTGTGNSGRSGNSNRSPAFTGRADSNDNSSTAPGESPPGEPNQPFTFRGFFGDEAR